MLSMQYMYCLHSWQYIICPYAFKTMLGKKTCAYIGAVQWNMLDRQMKVILSINSFKKRTKDWLLERVAK